MQDSDNDSHPPFIHGSVATPAASAISPRPAIRGIGRGRARGHSTPNYSRPVGDYARSDTRQGEGGEERRPGDNELMAWPGYAYGQQVYPKPDSDRPILFPAGLPDQEGHRGLVDRPIIGGAPAQETDRPRSSPMRPLSFWGGGGAEDRNRDILIHRTKLKSLIIIPLLHYKYLSMLGLMHPVAVLSITRVRPWPTKFDDWPTK
jgi:hypothetical protein